MRRSSAFLWLVLAATTVAGCGYLQDDPPPYRPPVYYGAPDQAARAIPVETGRHLYSRDCAYCHGDDGKGTARGPDLTVGTNGGALTDFVLRTGRMPVSHAVEQMKAGERVYNDEEIEALVTFVRNEFRPPGPDIPHVDLRRGKLSEGQQVYQEHCAACHATTGIGGAMLIHIGPEGEEKRKGVVIPGFDKSTARDVATAVRSGPGSMPVFGTRAISDDQLDSLLKYMVYLESPSDEGGAPIGRVGPVVEGAVGWLVGLGTLMLIIRWIGTKAGEV